jgi:F-type H+-transporting ATPase subunit b
MQQIIDSLGFDWKVWLLQIVVFVALWNAMSQLFWKPFLTHLQGRDAEISNAYAAVEHTRQEMENLRSEYQRHMAEIENDARTRIQTAIKEAQAERERIITEARTASDAAIREGLASMQREKEQALTDLRDRMVGLAVNAASKALGPVADATALRRSIEDRIAGGVNPARN